MEEGSLGLCCQAVLATYRRSAGTLIGQKKKTRKKIVNHQI